MIGRDVLQFRDLQELCRPGEKPRLATVQKWADDRGIRYQFDGDGGIWTTLSALEAAVGVAVAAAGAQPYDPAALFGEAR